MHSTSSLWKECRVKSVDHVAVTTSNLRAVLIDYLGIPGSELLRGPGYNSSQNVEFAFVKMLSGMVVEILGIRENSPISEHVANGGGAYHLCYLVEDLDYAIQAAHKNGAIPVVKSREDDAFDGRRVAFFVHPDHGLFEFLEAYPNATFIHDEYNGKSGRVHSGFAGKNSDADKIIKQCFYKVLPNLTKDSEVETAAYEITPGWTSFKHLQLFMEIEQLAGVSFTADEISNIQDYKGFLSNLKQKMGST